MDPETTETPAEPPPDPAPLTPDPALTEVVPPPTPAAEAPTSDVQPETPPEPQTEVTPAPTPEPPATGTAIPQASAPTERIYTDTDRAKSLSRKVAKKEAALIALMELVITRHELTVAEVETEMRLKKSTARTYLETLVERQLLTVRIDGRTRIYALPTSSHN